MLLEDVFSSSHPRFITQQNGSRYKQANCSRAGKAFRHTPESSSGIVTPSTQGTHSQPHRFCCTAGCVSTFIRRKLRNSLRTRAVKQQKCPKVAFKTKTLCVALLQACGIQGTTLQGGPHPCFRLWVWGTLGKFLLKDQALKPC